MATLMVKGLLFPEPKSTAAFCISSHTIQMKGGQANWGSTRPAWKGLLIRPWHFSCQVPSPTAPPPLRFKQLPTTTSGADAPCLSKLSCWKKKKTRETIVVARGKFYQQYGPLLPLVMLFMHPSQWHSELQEVSGMCIGGREKSSEANSSWKLLTHSWRLPCLFWIFSNGMLQRNHQA